MSEAQKIKDLPTVTSQNRADILKQAINLAKKNGEISSDEVEALKEKFGANQEDLKDALKQAEAEIALITQVKLEFERKRNDKIKWFKEKFPQFKGLVDKYPDRFEEWEKRAELYVSVKDSVNELIDVPNKIEATKKTLIALTTQPDNSYFSNNKLKVSFGLTLFTSKEITYAEFIAKSSNKTKIVCELFSTIKNSNEMSEEDQVKANRLVKFMESFDSINKESYKKEIMEMYDNLYSGNLDGAISSVEIFLSDDFDLDINTIVLNEHELFKGLRAIGDTTKATEVGVGLLKENTKLISDIKNNLENKKKQSRQKAEKKYSDILKSLEGTPTWYDFNENKEQCIDEFQNIVALTDIIDSYIKNNSGKNLGVLGQLYDDMRGVNGLINFSDENAKITGEVGIMVASFVLTAGLGSALSLAAGFARGIQLASTAARASRGVGAVNGLKNAGSLVNIGTFGTIAKTAEVFSIGTGALKKVSIIGDALIFTGADWTLRFASNIPGEHKEDMLSFGERFGKNFGMFALFGGFGKVLETLVVSKLPSTLLGSFAKFGTLSTGDVGAMYLLHLIETGKVDMSENDWLILALQVVGFRGIMKGIEGQYPRINTKINSMNEKNSNLKDGIVVENGVRKSTGVASESVLAKNGKLSDSERIVEAERLLGVKLTLEQQQGLLKAHNVEQGRNVVKGKILMKDGLFTREQAQILMDKGIAGEYVINGGISSESELLSKINESKLGDKFTMGGYVYRRTNIGWQRFPEGELLAGRSYSEGELITAEQIVADFNLELQRKRIFEITGEKISEAELLERINGSKLGDKFTMGGYVYRRTNIGWQRFPEGELLAGKSYSEGEIMTFEQVVVDYNLALQKRKIFEITGEKISEAELLERINGSKLGDKFTMGGYVYRRTNIGWQRFPEGELLAGKSYSEGEIMTFEQVVSEYSTLVGKPKSVENTTHVESNNSTDGVTQTTKELGYKNTKDYNHADINSRAEFRTRLDNAKVGDRVTMGNYEYTKLDNGSWTKFENGEGEMTLKNISTEQVMADFNLLKGRAEISEMPVIEVSRTSDDLGDLWLLFNEPAPAPVTAVPRPEPVLMPTSRPEPVSIPRPEPVSIPLRTPEPEPIPEEAKTWFQKNWKKLGLGAGVFMVGILIGTTLYLVTRKSNGEFEIARQKGGNSGKDDRGGDTGDNEIDFMGLNPDNEYPLLTQEQLNNGYTGKGVQTGVNKDGMKWVYKGDFVNGFREGKGQMNWSNGERFEGLSKGNSRVSGKYYRKDGSYFIGKFDDKGQFYQGVMVDKDGKTPIGKYENGVYTAIQNTGNNGKSDGAQGRTTDGVGKSLERAGLEGTQEQRRVELSPEEITLYNAISYNRKNYNSEEIRLIQSAIGLVGAGDDGVDGKVGRITLGKIKDFQIKNGLVDINGNPDGKVGPKTLGKMIGTEYGDYVVVDAGNGDGKIVKKENIIVPKRQEPEVLRPEIENRSKILPEKRVEILQDYKIIKNQPASVYKVINGAKEIFAVIGNAESDSEKNKIAFDYAKKTGNKVRVDTTWGSHYVLPNGSLEGISFTNLPGESGFIQDAREFSLDRYPYENEGTKILSINGSSIENNQPKIVPAIPGIPAKNSRREMSA